MPPKRARQEDEPEYETQARQECEELQKTIQSLDSDESVEYLRELETKWRLRDAPGNYLEQLTTAFENFDIGLTDDIEHQDQGSYGLKRVDSKIHTKEFESIVLYSHLKENGLLEDPQTQATMRRILESIYYGKKIVIATMRSKIAHHETYELDKDLDARLASWALRFRWMDQDTTDLQRLLLYLLDVASEKRLRKYGDSLYQPILVDNRYNTHAWKRVGTIQDFVFAECQKERQFDAFLQLTSGTRNPKTAQEYLIHCQDFQLPFLKKDRLFFSFRDGVYCARDDTFHPYQTTQLGDHVVCSKFFDLELTTQVAEAPTWDMIQTPNLDGIFRYQGFTDDTLKWFYVMTGRMMREIGSQDGWQVIPYILGVAGSGKCFAAGTEILMYDGTIKKVEDILPGDTVMGDDSTPRTVLDLARGSEELYRISGKFGSMTVTKEHILCLKYSNHKSCANWKYGKSMAFWDGTKFKSKKFTDLDAFKRFYDSIPDGHVIEMTVGDYLNMTTSHKKYLKMYHVGRIEFPEPVEPLFHPYALGAWLGDGHASGSRFTNFSKEVINALSDIGLKYGVCVGKTADSGTFGYIQIEGHCRGGNRFLEALRQYDMIDNKHIPHVLLTASVDNRLELLAGIIDTDGYKSPLGLAGFEVTQKNKNIADGIVFLAMSLGFGVTKKNVKKYCTYQGEKKAGMYYKVSIFGDGIEDIPCRIPKKRAEVGKRAKNALVYGFDIAPIPGCQPYFGFQTDGNQRFCLADGTVTHNSTIINTVSKIYDTQDVGVLSTNVEKKFGLSSIYDKFIFVAPELKKDFELSQAEFQSLVSGDQMSINMKYQTAFSVDWKVPGIIAANEMPNFVDTSGSISRRLVVFKFNNRVERGVADTRLDEQLVLEMPRIIVKMNKAYLQVAAEHGASSVWDIIPEEFVDSRDRSLASISLIDSFVDQPHVVIDPERQDDMFCSVVDFMLAMRNYASDIGWDGPRASIENVTNSMPKFGVKIKRERKMYRGKEQYLDYLCGLRIEMNEDPFS